jgi:hypothetical protein
LLALGCEFFVTASHRHDLRDWRVIRGDAATMHELGRVELGPTGETPLLLPGPTSERIGALGRRDLRVLDFAAGHIAWQIETEELSSAAWTPAGWVLGFWDDHPIQVRDSATGRGLGTLGIDGSWMEAQLWWIEPRLIMAAAKRVMTYGWCP